MAIYRIRVGRRIGSAAALSIDTAEARDEAAETALAAPGHASRPAPDRSDVEGPEAHLTAMAAAQLELPVPAASGDAPPPASRPASAPRRTPHRRFLARPPSPPPRQT